MDTAKAASPTTVEQDNAPQTAELSVLADESSLLASESSQPGCPKPDSPEAPEPTAGETAPAKYQKEIARLVEMLKQRQAEIQRLNEAAQNPKLTEPPQEKTASLHADELPNPAETPAQPESHQSENLYLQRMAELETRLAKLEHERETAVHQAQIAEAQHELCEIAERAVSEMVANAFPGLPPDLARLIESRVMRTADSILAQALQSEELSASLIERAANQALAEERQLYAVFGAKQIEDNEKYSRQHPAKPDDALPAAPAPKPISSMTKAERLAAADRAAAQALAEREQP